MADIKQISIIPQNNQATNLQIETLEKLKAIDFDNPETINCLEFLDKNLSSTIAIKDQTELETIQTAFSKESIKKKLEEVLKEEISKLVNKITFYITNLNKLSSNQRQIQSEYNKVLEIIGNNEKEINEMINYYHEFLRTNKSFLVRNEILKTFLEKLSITKEDKDNLVNLHIFDEKFFNLAEKISSIKSNILLIEKNSEHFSKNLLVCLKENTNLIDDLMNEKIKHFLKEIFSVQKIFDIRQITQIKKSLSYIQNKESILTFGLKAYTQYRKKNLDDFLKKKYLTITKLDELFSTLVDDFNDHFVKEIILLHYFFGTLDLNTDLYILINLFNNNFENLRKNNEYEQFLINFKQIFNSSKIDLSSFINLLNVILYSFQQIVYDNFKKLSNEELSLSRVYSLTVISHYFLSKVEILSSEFNLITNLENLTIHSVLSNNRKAMSKMIGKMYGDISKSVTSMKSNIMKLITSNSALDENFSFSKNLLNYFEEFSKVLNIFYSYSQKLTSQDREILNPRINNTSYKIMFEIFEGIDLSKENNIQNIYKLLDISERIIEKFIDFTETKEDYEKLNIFFNKSKELAVSLIFSNICKQSKFNEEYLKSIQSYEQFLGLIEIIFEKCQFYFLSMNNLTNSQLKSDIKNQIKEKFFSFYKTYIEKFKSENKGKKPILSEEEFKNQIEML